MAGISQARMLEIEGRAPFYPDPELRKVLVDLIGEIKRLNAENDSLNREINRRDAEDLEW